MYRNLFWHSVKKITMEKGEILNKSQSIGIANDIRVAEFNSLLNESENLIASFTFNDTSDTNDKTKKSK
jgi:hypothetical protein